MSKADSHFRLLLPSNYVTAADLRGKDVTLTIKSVRGDELPMAGKNEKKKAAIVGFEEASKEFVANITNLRTIAKALGTSLTADWVGKKITIYPTTTRLGPDTVECIRVRPAAPKAGKVQDEQAP